jgi:hypothetical protein
MEPSNNIQSLVESIDDDHVFKLTEMTKKRVEHNNPAQKRQRVVSLPTNDPSTGKIWLYNRDECERAREKKIGVVIMRQKVSKHNKKKSGVDYLLYRSLGFHISTSIRTVGKVASAVKPMQEFPRSAVFGAISVDQGWSPGEPLAKVEGSASTSQINIHAQVRQRREGLHGRGTFTATAIKARQVSVRGQGRGTELYLGCGSHGQGSGGSRGGSIISTASIE